MQLRQEFHYRDWIFSNVDEVSQGSPSRMLRDMLSYSY